MLAAAVAPTGLESELTVGLMRVVASPVFP